MTKNLKTKWVSTATRGTSCKVFDSSTTIRSALLTLLIIPIEDVVYDLTQGAHPAIFNRHLTAPEDTEGDRRWQEFIDRARANSSSGTNSQRYRRAEQDFDGAERDLDDTELKYELQENDMLWEIGCKVSTTNILLIVSNTGGLSR